MEITINIPNLENLASAINELAKTILSTSPQKLESITLTPEGSIEMRPITPGQTPYISTAANSATTQPLQQQNPLTNQIEAQYTQQPIQQQPIQQFVQQPISQPIQQPLQTVVPEYTQAQIANACAPLMDAGKTEALRKLLVKYGVQMITQLPKEAYGAFATDIRALGAKI